MMMKKSLKTLASELLQSAGVDINGNKPFDIQIQNEDFYPRVLKQGSLGLGESYMDKWWDCQKLDAFFEKIISADLENKIKKSKKILFKILMMKMINPQTKLRSLEVGRKHYDLGNLLFQRMLDSRMMYSCAYWKGASNLEEAQVNKLELSCQKLMLRPGMRVLDIGCGFGGFARYAAEKFGVEVVGVTISQQQFEYAQSHCKGLPIDIRFQDYRELNEKFDRIISIGMFEHVGPLNYQDYFSVVNRCLKEEGLFLLHTIGHNQTSMIPDEWSSKYIFQNSKLPSIAQIAKAAEDFLVMEDWHNFGADYDKTLMAWHENFNQHWDELKPEYDDRFRRMWNYYLLSSAGSFRARRIQLWQIVFSKRGQVGGYQRPELERHSTAI